MSNGIPPNQEQQKKQDDTNNDRPSASPKNPGDSRIGSDGPTGKSVVHPKDDVDGHSDHETAVKEPPPPLK